MAVISDSELQALTGGVGRVLKDELKQRDNRLAAIEARLASLESRVVALTEAQQKMVGRGLQYRGVWTEGESYEPGDVVTLGGAMWCCRQPTSLARPGAAVTEGARFWQLCVKAGKDAR